MQEAEITQWRVKHNVGLIRGIYYKVETSIEEATHKYDFTPFKIECFGVYVEVGAESLPSTNKSPEWALA